jgi:DnaJ-class molecular chaperone
MRKRKRKHNIWKDPSQYGTYTGPPGNARSWQRAFRVRFTKAERNIILGESSPWAVLGVWAGATEAEIKAAYRKRVKETHPDMNPGLDGTEFQQVQAAYEELL